jgi:Tetratricopeptide repeat
MRTPRLCRGWIINAVAFVVLMGFWTTVGLSGNGVSSDTSRTSPIRYLNTAPGVHYVGSNTCAPCHAEIYHSYMRTLMGRSISRPGDGSQAGLPTAPVTLNLKRLGRSYEVFRSGANLYQSEYALGPDGGVLFRDTRPISYVLGAGENGVGYIVQQGNYLFEAPLSYYTKSRTWELSPGYEFGDYGFHRAIPDACIICHSGRPQPVSDRRGLYKNPPFEELAIGCENCHGPGQLHVAERTHGAPMPKSGDRSIVNPADLAGWLANNICMICHQGGDTRILQPGKTYLDFRPGLPLDRTVAIFAVPFTPKSPPYDPLLQQYTQMILSKCYRASGGKMSCITCHDPHSEPTSAGAPNYFRRKCLTCHTEASCRIRPADRRRSSPPDNCVGCHMPRQKLQKISHSALTNHRIIAYPGEPFPSAAFHMTSPRLPDLVQVDADALPGTKQTAVAPIVLWQAYGELMESHPEYKPRYEQLLNGLSSLRNPLILSALGRRALLTGSTNGPIQAERDISQAIAQGSTVPSDFELDSVLLMRASQPQEAINVLRRGLSLNPYSTRLYKRLALIYIQIHQYKAALQTMKQELKIFPEDSLMRMLVARVESSPDAP